MTAEKLSSDRQVIDALFDTYSDAKSGSLPLDEAIGQTAKLINTVTSSSDVLISAKRSAIAGQVMTRLSVLVENPEMRQSALELAQLQLGSASRKLCFDTRIGIPTDNNAIGLMTGLQLLGVQKYIGSLILQRQVDQMEEAVESGDVEHAALQPFVALLEHDVQASTPIRGRLKEAENLFGKAWRPDTQDDDKVDLLTQSLSETISIIDDPDHTTQLDTMSRSSLNQLLAQIIHDLANLDQFDDNHSAKLASISHLGKISDTLSNRTEKAGGEIAPKRPDDMTLPELVALRDRYDPNTAASLDNITSKKQMVWYFRSQYAEEAGIDPESLVVDSAPDIIELATEYINSVKLAKTESIEDKKIAA